VRSLERRVEIELVESLHADDLLALDLDDVVVANSQDPRSGASPVLPEARSALAASNMTLVLLTTRRSVIRCTFGGHRRRCIIGLAREVILARLVTESEEPVVHEFEAISEHLVHRFGHPARIPLDAVRPLRAPRAAASDLRLNVRECCLFVGSLNRAR